jgi:hypothetical protein
MIDSGFGQISIDQSGHALIDSRVFWLRHDRVRRHTQGSPGFRTGSVRPCTGSLTARGPRASCDIDAPSVAFRISLLRRHPGGFFRGSMAGLHVPLSTLPHFLAGRRGMTRGSCGSLNFQRLKLSFTTTCRRDRRFQGAFICA